MTGPQTITIEHLRELLDTQDADAIIGLIGGEVRVIHGADRDDESNRGAIEVTSRESLVESLGDDPSEDELTARAEELTAASELQGG